jgi:hypothetical protein
MEERKLPCAIIEGGRELHLDAGAGAVTPRSGRS